MSQRPTLASEVGGGTREFALLRRRPGLAREAFLARWRASSATSLRNVVEQDPPDIFPRPEFDGIEISTNAGGADPLEDIVDRQATTLVRARAFPVIDRGFGPVKFMSVLRRKQGTTAQAFSDYWLRRHAPLVESIVEVSTYFRGYVQNHCIPGTQVGGSPIDGIVEIWFASLADLEAAMFSTNYMGALRADEERFVALPNRRMLVVEERRD